MTTGRTFSVPGSEVETVENAIQALEDLEDVDVDRTRGRAGEGQISTGQALAKVAEAYTGWSS